MQIIGSNGPMSNQLEEIKEENKEDIVTEADPSEVGAVGSPNRSNEKSQSPKELSMEVPSGSADVKHAHVQNPNNVARFSENLEFIPGSSMGGAMDRSTNMQPGKV